MSRTFGSLTLDDNVNAFIDKSGIVIPNARLITNDQMPNRYGRRSWVKDDFKPLDITWNGIWRDSTNKYWRDFQAALLGQSRANLVLGDGTRFEWVDVIEAPGKLIASSKAGTSAPDQVWAYSVKAISYEPFARDVSPSLTSLGALTTGAGAEATNFTVSYSGTAFAEPTWQFNFVIPTSQTVTAVQLQNTTTGESATWTGSLAAGTWYLLFDASGGVVGQTPSNNQYGLLAANTLGRGVTLYQSSTSDQDFTGQIPTLVASTSPSIPPVAQNNSITATVTASASLTSATLSVLAPNRWFR